MTKPAAGAATYTGSGTTGMPDMTVAGTIGQFVMIGLAGTTAPDPFSVQWCAIGDAQDWPTPGSTDARTKQSGKQTFPAEFGKVTGIAGNDFYGYVFQQRAIHKVQYIGGDVVFAFDRIDNVRGCKDYNRYVQAADNTVFFESDFGYHALRDDVVTDIGLGRVNESFTPSDRSAFESQQDVTINPGMGLIYFTNQGLFYCYETDQWSRAKATDSWPSSIWSTYTIDSPVLQMGLIRQSGVHRVDFQRAGDGDSLTGNLVTAKAEFNENGRALLDAARLRGTTGITITSLVSKGSDSLALSTSDVSATASAINTRTRFQHFRAGATVQASRYIALDVDFQDTGAASSGNVLYGVDLEMKITGGD